MCKALTASRREALELKRTIARLTDDEVQSWLEDQLNIEVRGTYQTGSWTVTEVQVLVTYGGPTTTVTWDGDDTLTIRVVRRYEIETESIKSSELANAMGAYAEAAETNG